MNDIVSLMDLVIGQKASVVRLYTDGAMRRRLLDIGLVEGTDLECVLKSPSGDPSAYFIRGAIIALRAEDAKDIKVSLL